MSQEAQNYEAHNVLRNFLLGAQTSVYQKILFFSVLASNNLENVADVRPSPQSGKSRKKIVYTEKVHEMDRVETDWWISSISFTISINKAGKFLLMFYEKGNLLFLSIFNYEFYTL